MTLEKIIIKGLYGYVDKTIEFYDDLTLLVGINGAGKTSVLNIVQWVLTPSIANLCITQFTSITLNFRYKDIQYTIICKHLKSTFKFELKSPSFKEKLNPLIVKIQYLPSEIDLNDKSHVSSLISDYSRLKPDAKERKTWDILSTFPTPTVIGLDRKIYMEEADRLFVEESNRSNISRKTNVDKQSPVDRVKDIINSEYRKSKNAVLNLTSNLKNHLMLSTFDGGITIQSFTSGISHNLNLSQIEIAEERVYSYFEQFEKKLFSASEKKVIKKYFHNLKDITSQYEIDPENQTIKLLYGLNATQFIKVINLLKEFENFEIEANAANKTITVFTDTINYFFKDSSKKLTFDEENFEVKFDALDRNSKVVSPLKDIDTLSSGELQILTLFSYVAFNSKDGRIFIIDEPELSLHIKWQEDFLQYLELNTPKFTQLILATHSPIIVSKRKEKTKVLFPYN